MAVSREKVVHNAEKYVSRGKIDAAIKEYRKLLAENPNDISTLNRVGDLYARINRNSEAIDLFNQIAEQYSDDGFFVKSIAIYKKIIKLDPTLLEVYEKLADLYHRQGLVNEARTQYQVLADYYLKHDRTSAAIGIYRRMAELEPEDPSHHVKLADLYQEDGQVGEAMGEYRAIADLMLQHDRGNEAARVFARALDIDSEDVGFITDAVLKLKEAGHVAAAAHFLSLAVERNPKAEKVARVAGLADRPEAAPAEPPVPAEPPAEAIAEEEAAPSFDAEPETELDTELPEGPAGAEPEPEEERAEPEPAGFDLAEEEPATAPAGAGGEDLPALGELDDGAAFELDLLEGDDDEPESLVRPPADMLEDSGRRGAAWGGVAPADASEVPEAPLPSEVAEPGGPAPADGEGGTGTFEFELDLGDVEADGAELLEPAGERPDLDHDLLERTAAEVQPERSQGVEDLFTEAEVLSRYGIEEKALERLAELLQRDPQNLPGYRLMVGIHLDAGRHQRAAAVAEQLAAVAERLGDDQVWPELRGRLEEAGYVVEPGRIEPPAADLEGEVPPAAEAAAGEAVAPEEEPASEATDLAADGVSFAAEDVDAATEEVDLSEADVDLAGDQFPATEEIDLRFDDDAFELPEVDPGPEASAEEEAEPLVEAAETEPVEASPAEAPSAAAPPRRRKREDVESALADLAGRFLGRRTGKAPARPEAPSDARGEAASAPETAAPEPPAPAAAPPPVPEAPAAGVDPLRALGDSLRAEIGDGAGTASEAAGPGAAEEARDEASPDDTGMSWLDEAATVREEQGALADEADFFDLGAELEQELSREDQTSDEDLAMAPAEQSLEEIVEGFKRGVAENLSPEDFDTHFNLGIAYREMGLLDEAIGEFQVAAREPSYLVACASMLGLCFREKGLPELAVKWYRRGLDAPGAGEDDRAGLLYDLGEAQVAAGDRMAAYHTFVDLYGIDTSYRDVVARLAELEPAR